MTKLGSCSGGIAAARRPVRSRNAFLGTVAAGALSLAFGGPALAGNCTTAGTVATCTGNNAAGISNGGGAPDFTSPPVTTLDVNSLTTAIAPAAGTNGITFTSAGAVNVNSDTGAFGISTTGYGALGLYAKSTGAGIAVTVTSTGDTSTTGDEAAGIRGRSAGDLTLTSTGNIVTAGYNSTGISAATSGAGGVTITSTGNLTTHGQYANAIYARTNAGGGGIAVTSTGDITVTGASANGVRALSYGGPVAVTSTGNITTTNGAALGIQVLNYASNAGVTVTSTGNITTGGSAITATSHGGVTVTSTGNVTTTGNFSYGVQAANYGNGVSKVTSTGNITTAGGGADGLTVKALGTGSAEVISTGNIATVGGTARGIYALGRGAGGVTVSSTGNISTAGFYAHGIYASNNFGVASFITVTSIGNITTGTLNSSDGIFASSAYGGSGPITITSTGDIRTSGDRSNGIRVEGTGGAVAVTSTGNITTGSSDANGIYVATDDGSAVTVTSKGNITTAGDDSLGIRIQAQGAGAVTVSSTGDISTSGANAFGILARSAGTVTVISTGNVATTGAGASGINAYSLGAGAVAVTSSGNISATGSNTVGILAASLGAVTVNSTGNVAAAGANGIGIVASSTGGPIAVTIKSGTVSGSSGSGAGVTLLGRTTNTLTNMGTVTALSGLAISGNTGNTTVNNFGTVIGNVVLGSGADAFNNMAGGLFNSGAIVNLGTADTLTNGGTLSPGGAGAIQTTALTGNLVQSPTGRLLTDINVGAGTSDRVNVSGTANLAGAVQLQVQNPIFAAFQQTILSALGGATNNGLTLLASPALQAQLVFPNATDVVVKSSGINFVVSGLSANQTALGNALNGAAHSSGFSGPVFNLLLNGVTTLPGYNLALTQLSGETATGSQQTTFDAMNMFMGVMTDPFNRGGTSTPGGAASGYASGGDINAYASDSRKRTIAERDAYAMFTKAPLAQSYDPRWSVWAAGFGGAQNTDGNTALGSNNTTSSVAGTVVGADYRFSPFTVAGFALAGGGTSFSVAGSGSGRSDLFQAGAYIQHDAGAAYISGALAYGWQDIITERTVTLAGFDQLRAEFDANALSGRVEGGYRLVAPWVGGIGITPYAAGRFTTFDLPAYAETALAGSGAFALSYAARSVTDPRSEFGVRTDKSYAQSDGVLTLRSRLAWAHDYDTDRSIGATFQSLPGASFVVNGAAQASDSALVTASVEKRWFNGWSAAATFEGEFSNVTASYAGKGVVRYQW